MVLHRALYLPCGGDVRGHERTLGSVDAGAQLRASPLCRVACHHLSSAHPQPQSVTHSSVCSASLTKCCGQRHRSTASNPSAAAPLPPRVPEHGLSSEALLGLVREISGLRPRPTEPDSPELGL